MLGLQTLPGKIVFGRGIELLIDDYFFSFFPLIRARSRIWSYLNKGWDSSSTESKSTHSVSGLILHCTIVKVTASLNITLQASLDSTWVPALLLSSPPFMFQVFPPKHSLNGVSWTRNTILTRWPAIESWLLLPAVWQGQVLNLPVPWFTWLQNRLNGCTNS